MSTRCYIGIKNSDGSVDAIYCHHDGYFSYMGNMLMENYKDEKKVRELIALGDVSSVGERIYPTEGSGHSFENPERGVTVAYHRDRGEDYAVMHCDNIGEFWAMSNSEYSDVQHQYLYYPKDSSWMHWYWGSR